MKTAFSMNKKTENKILESLYQLLYESKEGYKFAAKKIEDSDFRLVFSSILLQRKKLSNELEEFVNRTFRKERKLKSEDEDSVWFHANDSDSEDDGKNENWILNECEQAENELLHYYEQTLKLAQTQGMQDLLVEQYKNVKAAHDYLFDLIEERRKFLDYVDESPWLNI